MSEEEQPFVFGRYVRGAKINGIPEAEYHVLIGLCNLYSTEQIAAKMYVTTHAIRSHRIHLYSRLGVSGPQQAILEAWRRKILNTCPTCRRPRDDDAPQVEPEDIVVPEKKTIDGVKLTRRLNQVLHMLAKGMSTPEIGKALRVSEFTAKTHIRLLFAQLNVHNRAHAVAVGYETGILKIGDVPR